MKFVPIAILAATVFALPALAEHPGHGKGHKHHDESAASEAHDRGEDRDGPGFSDRDHDVIDGYFRSHPDARSELPPGLAKKHKIPPGWRKKLARGEHVPDDVWEHRVALPPEVVVKLPIPPVGVVYVRIQDRVAKVVEKTHEVLDVLGLPEPRSMPPR